MDKQELKQALELHALWLKDDENGQRANLWDANLWDANLQGANLRGANLRDANLWDANLQGANLQGANLWDANLRGANLRGANLWDANLQGANLWDANLQGANLRGAIGNMKHVRSIQIETYQITYTSTHLQIGCKCYTFDEWRNFTDYEIDRMDSDALKWWCKWKDWLFTTIEMSPAEPTGYEG